MTEQMDHALQRKVARAELSRRAFWMSVAILCAAFFGAMGWTVYEVRSTQLEGTPTGQKLLTSADRIIDCTTPEGECYKRSQQRTGDAVSALNDATLRIVAAALACQAEGITQEDALLRCVTQRLQDAPEE